MPAVAISAFSLPAKTGAVRTARTDDQGRYRLRDLDGRYLLVVSSEPATIFAQAPDDWDYDTVRVPASGAAVHDIWLRKPTVVSGSVSHETRPIPRAHVRLFRFNRDGKPHSSWPTLQAKADAEGAFRLTVHYPGRFWLMCSIDDFQIGLREIRLDGGAQTTRLLLGECELRLRIVDSSKKPVETVSSISCVSQDRPPWRVDYRPGKFEEEYRIRYLFPGKVSVLAVDERGASVRGSVEIKENATADLELTLRVGQLKVIVRDQAGRPVSGVGVRIEPERGGPPRFGAPTGKDGVVLFSPRPGRWRVGIAKPDFSWVGETKVVEVGTEPVVVELKRG